METVPHYLEDGYQEIWANKKTGSMVIVYERNSTFIRMQKNCKEDMAERGHGQLPWESFNRDYKFIGKLSPWD